MCKGAIKTAILQTAGPVSTCESVRYNWKFLRYVTVKQFNSAAVDLESAHLGHLVSIGSLSNCSPNPKMVFVKRPPCDVMGILQGNPGLCEADIYSMRFQKPSPKSISLNVRKKLVAMGLVSESILM